MESAGTADSTTSGADAQNLPAFVVTARRAGGMRCYRASTLRAFVQLRGLPAMRRFARAQPHLRGFAFRNSHGEREPKHRFGKRQIPVAAVYDRRKLCARPNRRVIDRRYSFSLSSALQSGGRLPGASGVAATAPSAGHFRPPSRSQCGWGGKFNRMSSRT